MRAIAASAVLFLACAGARPGTTTSLVPRSAELARVRCLLVLPFENVSTVPAGGEAATNAVFAGVDANRTAALPIQELRALFRDTPFELPQGVPPSLALELAELLEADGALYGTVEGRAQDGASTLTVTLRLELVSSRDLLFAATVPVELRGEDPERSIARAAEQATAPLFDRLGGAIRPAGCFDGARIAKLRALARAQSEPRPEPARRAGVRSPAGFTKRQAAWAERLRAGDRIAIDGVVFEGRSARIESDGGLIDLAKAMQAEPRVRVRIEGFVDPGGGQSEETRLSTSMAQAAGRRLIELGIAKERVAWVGRGATRPVLPNFTIRGRTANRRLEVVVLK